jgi:uncharacterized protein YigE (DUF2233 family)
MRVVTLFRSNILSAKMKRNKIVILLAVWVVVNAGLFAFTKKQKVDDARFVSYVVDVKKQDIQFYWKDDNNQLLRSIGNLQAWVEKSNRKLAFAMNGGMYKADNSPQGLFIQKQVMLSPLDTASGGGNFYVKPNGVFYITTDNVPVICTTPAFKNNGTIKYATQSGPMLVVAGQIHPAFKQGSTNLNIRNGVGILPGGKVIFAMSKAAINFYDFADYFKRLGCKNALYLDGFISRTYLPEKNWVQTDGNFGVMIGVTTVK